MFLRAEPIVETNSSPVEWLPVGDEGVGKFNMDVSISIKIIDTDFEDIAECWSVFQAIVDVYERRNLNVAANLAIYIHNNPNVMQTYDYYKSTPEFFKYVDQVNKYLMLV